MYGPPPSPAEITAFAPWWAWCGSIGLALIIMVIGYRAKSGPRFKLFWYTLASTILLTAPTLFLPEDIVWGAYPTLDKKTSLLMYLDHAHWLPIGNLESLKSHTPLFLIGIHICHLWVTELIDLLLSTSQAINLHSWFNLWLSAFAAGLFIQNRTPNQLWCSLLGGLSFGLSLHQFRDIQWYTVEKTGIYWIPLFLLAMDLVNQKKSKSVLPAVIWIFSAVYNLYVSLILAACGLIYGLLNRTSPIWLSLTFCIVGGVVIGGLQYGIMTLGPEFASPSDFQQRATLDVVAIWPPMWNRLELWWMVSPLMLIGVWTTILRKEFKPFEIIIAIVFFLLSLGPQFYSGMTNPLYMVFSLVPGMWRMAKPEFFFTAVYLMLCLWMTKGLSLLSWNQHPKRLLPAFVLLWILGCRLHPVYPKYSQYTPAQLDPQWEERVFQGSTPDEHLLPSHQK